MLKGSLSAILFLPDEDFTLSVIHFYFFTWWNIKINLIFSADTAKNHTISNNKENNFMIDFDLVVSFMLQNFSAQLKEMANTLDTAA